jgi:hypothetical protein
MAWDAGWRLRPSLSNVLNPGVAGVIVVTPAESIAAAIERAAPGSTVVVEPGEYRERLPMKDNVRVISRVPRAATLRLPSTAGETEALVIAAGVTGAELNGFRIIGDAASSLGVGIITRDAGVRLVDLEITGASIAGIDFGPGDDVVLIGSYIHDNHGSAFIARSGSTARVAHNVMSRNGTSNLGTSALVLETGALPTLSNNVFHGTDAQALVGSEAAARLSLPGDNWFIDTRAAVPAVRAGAPLRRAP